MDELMKRIKEQGLSLEDFISEENEDQFTGEGVEENGIEE